MLPPVKLMLVDPATAVAVPLQVFDNPFGVATTSPVGKVSVNATPVSATVLAAGFVIVKVSVVVPFSGMLVGLNALAITGGATTVRTAVLLVVGGTTTVMDAFAVLPVPPLVEVTCTLLFFTPPVVP